MHYGVGLDIILPISFLPSGDYPKLKEERNEVNRLAKLASKNRKSFHEDQPRKAAVKGRIFLQEITSIMTNNKLSKPPLKKSVSKVKGKTDESSGSSDDQVMNQLSPT